MIMATLNEDERTHIARMLTQPMYECIIAFDPIDEAFKFKIDQGTWSPPFGIFQTPDIASMRPFIEGLRSFMDKILGASKQWIHR